MGRLKQAAIWITLLSLLLKVMGFFRESAIAWEFGASELTNGFFLAFAFVTLTVTMVANGFNTVFLPEYLRHRREMEGREGEAERDASGVLSYTVLLFLLMSIILYVIAPWFVPFIYPGMGMLEREVAVEITRVFFLFMSVIALSGMLESYLQSLRIFVPTQVAKISGTLFSVVFIFLFGDMWGIHSVAYGFVFGTMIGAGVQFYYLMKGGFRFRPTLKMDFGFLKGFLLMLAPALLHSSVGHVNVFVDKAFAAGIPGAAVTYLNNASLLMSIPSTMFATTFVAIVFTLLSERADDTKAFQDTLFTGYQLGVIVLLPIAVGIFLIGEQAIAFIYERGQFTAMDTEAVFDALKFYVPIIVTQGLLTISVRAMYASGRGKQILMVSSTTILLNLLFNYLLVGPLGYPGLALSSALVSLYYFTMITLVLYRDHAKSELVRFTVMLLRAIPPVVIMGVVVWAVEVYTPVTQLYSLWQLAILGSIGALVYVGSVYVLYRSGFQAVVRMVKKRA
ncbi:murein biosynthesis integral membrane protein MurJ [Salimicrobium halophilum]|uniref:Putative peptidoglycan lipid II flippase n=1 Tax=Salimicrobium halophilum TaxID=86666 RepID=A0A1G8SGK2_9BACI|nr:lipid II flippase MurJ [Salimicrobium halophilum]SDJ27790.1 putative peptidoglycan lipid II flippase [Salimicrobium halophilum]